MQKRHWILLTVVTITVLSGFCSLVYQVVWDRTVKYNFGGDSISSAIVTGTFLLGLGLGAYLFGQWRRDAFKAYAVIELLIGVLGILSFYIIAPVASTLASILNTGPDAVEDLRPAVVIGCILLLLPPCTLIGGTLPLMLRCFVQPLNFSAKTLGFLYGINTLGAALGILAVPLFLLNRHSLPNTLSMIGCINMALAFLIWFVARRVMPGESTTPEPAPSAKARETRSAQTALKVPDGVIWLLAFLAGFIALSFEVSLFRAFALVNPSSAYNFPVVLVFFLLALALGSITFTRGLQEDVGHIMERIGWLLSGAAVALLVSIWMGAFLHGGWYPVSFMPILDGAGYDNVFWVLLFCVVLVMPVPFMTGAIFPLLLRIKADDRNQLPQATGSIYLANSLGGFCGAIGGKFVGFAYLGTEKFMTLLFLMGIACGVGVLVWRRLAQKCPDYGRPAAFTAIALLITFAMPKAMWRSYITGGPESNWEFKEGVSGVAQIWWEDDFGHVRVNGQYMSRLPHHPRHIKQEMFLLAQPGKERVLVLGIGGAGLIRSLVDDPQVSEIYAVDWSYELPDLLSGGRPAELLNQVMTSPKIKVLRTDARVAVGLFDSQSFDLVFDNLAFPSWAGASSIKSATYYSRIKRLLKPGGVFITGGNHFGANRLGVLAGLLTTFGEVHEHEAGEVVICGTYPPALNDEEILSLMSPRAADLHLNPDPAFLINWFRQGFTQITPQDLGDAVPIRDDLLVNEYYWKP